MMSFSLKEKEIKCLGCRTNKGRPHSWVDNKEQSQKTLAEREPFKAGKEHLEM